MSLGINVRGKQKNSLFWYLLKTASDAATISKLENQGIFAQINLSVA